MKIKEIRKMKDEEFNKKQLEINSELIKLKGQSATGTPPKNPGQIKQIKKTIAQMNTIKREKEIELIKKTGRRIK